MASLELNLAIDIGSTGIRIGEFEYQPDGSLVLQAFTCVEFTEPLSESNRTSVIKKALSQALTEGNFSTKRASVCVSGQAAFMRFVNLPPVSEEESRIKQIVEYEAKQNVPFPMDEVIWDYQLVSGPDDDLEVMFVVIKNEIVESIINAVTDAGLKPHLVDFAPSALYNVARASHIGDNECSMVLNIGGRCTTLLFLDGERFFARTIPIGGFSITQQITKEFGINHTEAETLKRRHGFVALGGAYEEPESEVAATISKIIRNVMTRLHGEVNRSISVYRTQQKGNKPIHLYLSGGSSTMAFTDHFFSEKLRMEVSYLNPFKILSLNREIDVKGLEDVAHLFPETIGLGLRNSLECPVEITLIPDSLKKQQSFSSRKPFIIMAAFFWILTLCAFVSVLAKKTSMFSDTAKEKQDKVEQLNTIKDEIISLESKQKKVQTQIDTIDSLLGQRFAWSEFFNALQLSKPQDVWILGLTKETAPKKIAGEKPKKKNSKKVNPFAKKKRRIGKTAPRKPGKDDAVWFTIDCQAITIPSTEPPRKIFTDIQLAEFRKIHKDRIGSLEEIDPSEGKVDTQEDFVLTKFWEPNSIDSDTILSEMFLKSLRWSDMFSDDDYETRILSSRFSDQFRNLTTFRIQIKLNEPIPITR